MYLSLYHNVIVPVVVAVKTHCALDFNAWLCKQS